MRRSASLWPSKIGIDGATVIARQILGRIGNQFGSGQSHCTYPLATALLYGLSRAFDSALAILCGVTRSLE
jgi:hypothetical protein